MLPSHWLSIAMTVSSRTTDDFASFVNFINLPDSSTGPSNVQIGAILSGISRVTLESTLQTKIFSQLIEVRADRILKSRHPEKIAERAYEEAQKIRDQEMEETRARSETALEDLSKTKSVLDQERLESERVKSQLEEAVQERTRLQALFRKKEIEQEIRNWKRMGWGCLAAIFLGVAYVLLQLLGPDAGWNVPGSIARSIDSIQSETGKNLMFGLNYIISIGLTTACTRTAWMRLASKRHEDNFIRSLEYPNA
jgi:hypothetical protein